MVVPIDDNKVWQYQSKNGDRLSKIVEKDKDIVNTKPEMAQYLISLIKFKKNDIVLEPCKGTGSFYDAFPKYTINKWCEINCQRNFFDFNEKVDYVISNPPFVPRKLFWQFQQHAMSICRKEIYWLINLSSLNVFTSKRLKEMHELGWYINSLHIVEDRRWFGRYCFIKISKKNNGVFTYCDTRF